MSSRTIATRSAVIFFIGIGCYAILWCNLFVIQLLNSSFFASLGNNQYRITMTKLPERGPIVDRTGSAFLATNRSCISAFLIPKKIENRSLVQNFLEERFPAAASRLKKNPNASFIYIKRRLTDTELKTITTFQNPDIHLLEETNRFYPLPSAAPLIGFTNIDNVGCAGIEQTCNEQLTGAPLKMLLEKDARSGYFYFHKELQDAGTQSMPIQLTIDSTLQFLVDEELADACKRFHAVEASAIILDPDTGDILTLSSYPYTNHDDPHFDFYNTKQRAVTEQYELGSVLKVFAALAALEQNAVEPDELINCRNSKKCTIDGRPITTWTPHGIIPFSDVIAFSNNIGIAQVAKRLGPDIVTHYEKLGFGKKTGIALPAEARGFVNPPDKWSAQSIISLSYGYEISASLLQLAQAFALIAHNGHFVKPRLLLSDQITISEKPLYRTESIESIKDILRKTTERGTGRRAQLKGFTVMSKTGSANTLVNGIYDHDKNIYTAAAIIQKGSYKRVVVTFVKQADVPNAFASTIAMPVLRRIAEKMVIHERML